MKSVRIDKDALRERVQANRDQHRELYEKAIEGYRKTVIDWFNDQVDRAKAGKSYETYFSMPKPEDHTDDYDRVLDMLDMSIESNFELSQQEFAQYVRDDWGWKREFTATSSNYVA
jgi:hypothetical protein